MFSRQHPVLRRIILAVVSICAVFLFINGLIEGDWLSVGLSVVGAGFLLDSMRPGRRRKDLARGDPETVPWDAVASAIAATDSRIPAIKLLRQHYPGLGLKDAKDLVDAQLPT